ncbi:unnamed protein product [Tuber melanosporum]|uniref:(Perigord truffle) hypothetical protein n=1 Tax=Tuber melanosporum (strain Mel28) TaxID=656061 RepID=D5G714_TUBMM|nr:uncharacterized protein GSTUM_00004552001 [Tuber melanosporum]CAZ80307.1 unnamed protein product [Tuber melanosporum]
MNIGSLLPKPPGKGVGDNRGGDSSTGSAVDASGGDGGLVGQLSSNPLFTGGVGIILLTAAAQLARKSLTSLSTHLRNQMLVTLEIPSTDKSYDWFLHWMSQNSSSSSSPRSTSKSLLEWMTTFRPAPRHLAVETKYIRHASGGISTDFTLLPGTGRHLLNFRGNFLRVNRERDAKRVDLQRGTPWELITITTLFASRSVFPALLQEARDLAVKLEEGKTIIYTSWSTEWKPFGRPRRKRPLSSVVLKPGLSQELLTDVKSFLNSARWYYDRGIPYRRGYLLYGPPGTGKSSFVQALAGELDYGICLLNLSERGLTDDRLNHLLSNMPERSIALLEDVDAAFGRGRAVTEEDGYRGANVTFSGLLNALDGVASSEERIVVMTTNYPERLDEALVRPGRVDVKAEIGYAGREEVEVMWERFYGGESVDGVVGEEELARRGKLREVFVERLEAAGAFEGRWGVSAASLQGLFVYFKGKPERAVENVGSLVPEGFR